MTKQISTEAHAVEIATIAPELFRATVYTNGGILVFSEYFDNAATAEQEARDFAAYYAAKYAA